VPAQLVSVLFTATDDLDADFPAHAARRLGWTDVPLLCAREIAVLGAPRGIVRVLLTVRDARVSRLEPVYLGAAIALRPDLAPAPAARAATAAPPAPAARVAIIGLGQIGGSIGLALGVRGGWRRAGYDVDAARAGEAVRIGAIDVAAPSVEEACAGAEIAIVAVPMDALAGAIDLVAAALPRGAVLVDTGSARAGVTEALSRAASRGVRAVGGHPLAGSQGHGLDAANAAVFRGAPFVLLPVAGEVPDTARRLVADLGARIVEASPDAHDQALARTSHLPYLVALAIEGVGHEAAEHSLSGPGFRDMTRLAASDPRVAMAYCRANAREVRAAWGELREAIERRVRDVEA
jgi:prephenate dehydrogenase